MNPSTTRYLHRPLNRTTPALSCSPTCFFHSRSPTLLPLPFHPTLPPSPFPLPFSPYPSSLPFPPTLLPFPYPLHFGPPITLVLALGYDPRMHDVLQGPLALYLSHAGLEQQYM